MDGKGQARDLEAVSGVLQCPRGWAVGPRWVRTCQQRVATLASTTWGLQSEPSLSIEKGVLDLWGRWKRFTGDGHFSTTRHTSQTPITSSNSLLPAWQGRRGLHIPG